MTVACWILAQTWDTFSKSIDWRVMLFFYYSFLVTKTPSGASILLFILKPKKFFISTVYALLIKNYSAVVEHVYDDWEMGVGQDHLKLISVGNSVDHVSNCWSDGTEDSVSLLLLEPHSELDWRAALFVLILHHFERNMLEWFGQAAELALHWYGSWFNIDCDSFGDFQFLLWDDVFHYHTIIYF